MTGNSGNLECHGSPAAELIGHGVFTPAQIRQQGEDVVVRTPLGDLLDVEEPPAHRLPRRPV